MTLLLSIGVVTTANAQSFPPGADQPKSQIKILGNIFGGGDLAKVEGNTAVVINKGQFAGEIFGGGNGALNDDGTVKASADITKNTSVTINGGEIIYDNDHESKHNIYGGGNLACNVGDSTNVEMNKGMVTWWTFLSNQTAVIPAWYQWYDQAMNPNQEKTPICAVFGAGYGAHTDVAKNTNVTINIEGNSDIKPANGTSFTHEELEEIDKIIMRWMPDHRLVEQFVTSVHGGGYDGTVGAYDTEADTISTNVTIKGQPFIFNVFGGGLGSKDGADANGGVHSHVGTVYGGAKVDIQGGIINGDVFGGGAGIAGEAEIQNPFPGIPGETVKLPYTYAAQVLRETDITIDGASTVIFGSVYGGGDIANTGWYTEGARPVFEGHQAQTNESKAILDYTTSLNLNGGNILGKVYGGGNGRKKSEMAMSMFVGTVTGSTNVKVNGSSIWSNIYGGGNTGCVYACETIAATLPNSTARAMADGVVDGCTNVEILGGLVAQDIFGGGFGDAPETEDSEISSADVAGNTYVYFENADLEFEKYWKPREVATEATMGSWSNPTGEDTGKFLTQRSGIHEDIDYRNTESDICHNLYGGGNMACTVKGNTHVYMVGAPTAPDGFDKTDYYNDCISNVAKPHFSAFGGGFGKWAIVMKNAYSNIVLGRGTGLHSIIGGGMNGTVIGSTKVHVGNDPMSKVHFVYGGGYYAPCHDTQLDITRGTILEDVFGGSVMGDINNGGALTDIATNTTIGLQEGGSVVLKDENDKTVNTYDYANTQNKLTIYGNVYGGNDVSGTVNGIAQLNIYGGEIKKNVYAAGNGDHIGYYEPGIGAYNEGKNDNYYLVDHSDDKDSNGNAGPKGNTYKGRPQTTGGVALTLVGNSVEDRVKVLGQVFGGGNSCTIGQWNAELLNDPKYHGDPHLVRDDPTYFLGGGQLHITLGSHITIGRTHTELESYGKEYLNEEGENISGLYMGCSGMHLATQNTDIDDHYYHHYYDKNTAKYWPGFTVYSTDGDGQTLLTRAEGLASFNAYLNNILVWSDSVRLNIDENAEDIWLANFVGGGFRGSMKAMTADGQFAYSLPRGVTVGNGIVGGAYNTDVVYRIYDTTDGHNYTIENGHYKYLTTPGELTKYDKDTNRNGDYHHIEYAEDGTTPTGIIRFYYDGGILKSNDRGDEVRAGKVFLNYSNNNGTFGDDNVIDFSGKTEAHGLRSHKSHALLYLDLRCQLEPEVINNSVHGGNVFGGCFASGTVEGDVWTDYRAYIAQKWYGNENFNGGPKMFSNAADYQQNFAMMAFGAGYGKNTSIKGDTYLRVIYNNENGKSTYPCLYNVFGGSYHGTVDGNANIYYNAGQQGLTVGGIYGGGSQGYVAGKTFVELAGGYIANVYGGAREANVGRGTHVWAYDGIKRPWGDDLKEHDNAPLVIERMFGGSDVSGLIGFKADATDVDDAEGRVEGTGWTAYYSTDSWPEELYVNGKDGELKRFDSYIQIGGTDHSDRGYPLVGQIFAGGNGENTDSHNIIPGIDYAFIELNDGNVMEAFGGGNAATVHKQNYILVNGQYDPVTKMEMPNPLLTQILQERVLKSAPDRYSVTGNTFTFKPNNVQRLFGGNNLATMDIQPKWNLKAGHIGSVYSGGNMGDMTYYNATPAQGQTKGLSITVDSEDINIESLYGGCRMSNVRASRNDDNEIVYPTFSADEYGATVNVISGTVGNVYGGNDVSGYVYNGTNVNISGSITGNVYGAGNGDYLYGYDKDGSHEFTQNDDIIMEWDNDIKKMLYWMKGDKDATPLQQLLALNNMRPHVEKAYLNIQGESEEKKVYIHGSVYCGGNASTIRPMTDGNSDAHVKFNIGDNVIVNEVFMGSNGESLKYDAHNQSNTYLVDFEKINKLNLATDDAINWSVLTNDNTALGDKELLTMNADLRNRLYPNLLSVYMRAVDMKAMPQGFEGFSNHEFKNTWIGTFCMGGNAGSMMTDQPIDIVFPQSLNFFGRIIGGSKDASFQYKGKWHRGGFRVPLATDATLDGEPTKTKLRMKIRGNWFSRRMVMEEQYKTAGEYAPMGDYLVLDKTNDGVEWDRDGKAWHDGCNVYGGCYLSGDMVGDVQIYVESDMLAYSDPRYSTTIDTYTNAELDESNKLNIPVANVYGAGYGPESRNYGDAYIYMKDIPHASSTTHPSVNNIYGGGRNGMLIGNSVIHVHDGLVFQDVVGGCFAAPLYGSSQVTVGYPKFYICKQTGEYFLDRADIWNEGYDTKGYKGKESVIKKSIKYFEGTYVPCNIYDRITGVKPYNNNKAGNLLELSNDNKSAYFEYHDEYTYNSSNPENFFPEGGWDNVEIRVRGGVYGGGFSLSNSTSAVAGSYTTLASTEEYNHGVDSKGNSSIGFGGNSSIIITDKGDTKNHIKISTETVREGDNPHKEYTGRGGVYGDGRLVFCEGFRTAELNGYGYAEGVKDGEMNPLMLNSLQRLDLLTVNDCNFKLYGDQDFATDQIDARKYSLARIGELCLNSSIDATQNYGIQRNYIAFYNNIHYLGAIVTNDNFHTGLFHDATGAVGTQTYRAKKQEYIANYHGKDDQQSIEAFKQRNYATARNMVGINSGYCLRVENQYYNENDEKGSYYGPIVGVAEVKLLNVQPGEGGGYVYADNIHADIYNGNGNEPTFMNESGNFVFEGVHRPGDAEGEKQYIVDDCLPTGFDEWAKTGGDSPEQHYWYVIGDTYYYNTTLTGYTFSGEKTFNLVNADPNVIFAGIEEGDEVSLQSVKWIPATYPDGYSGDLRSGRDADLTPLSGTDKYKFTLQVGEDAWSAVMPRTTVNDTEALTAATAWTEYTTTSSPRFNVQLIDNVNNSPSGSEEAYFNDHLSVPEKVQLVIKARKGDEIKTYNVTLEVVYLQGPSFTGNVNILNCALPGERIGFNSKDIKVKTTEHLPLTSFGWKLVPTEGDAVTIPEAYYTTNAEGYVEGSIPALYSQNRWNIHYTFNAGGEEFSVTPTTDEQQPLNKRMIVVHNYHKMADIATQYDVTLATTPDASSSVSPDAYVKALKSGAMIYLADNADIAAFVDYVNNGNATEGMHFYLQNNFTLPAAITGSFAGTLHGDGYSLTLPKQGNSLFGNGLTGKVYNLGITNGTITTVPDASASVINCFTATDNADDLRYGKKAYALSHFFTESNDESDRNGYVHTYYADNDAMGGDWRYARTASYGVEYLRKGTPNYGQALTNHNTDHADAYTPVEHDYLFFGQALRPDAPKAYPEHINTDEVNRVYRTDGYYRSTTPDAFHYNKAAWAMQPTLTAIDFAADNAASNAVDSYKGKTDDRPAVLTSFNSNSNASVEPYNNENMGKVTQNLLVYHNEDVNIIANERPDTEEAAVIFHSIRKTDSGITTPQLHLVDKQEFCAPIAFNVTTRAWYERTPSYCAENNNSAWEGICLPFTVKKVEASTNGEISHFYGEPTEAQLAEPTTNDRTLHHEYWLRGLVSVASANATTTATFQRPGDAAPLFATAAQTAAAFDYMYAANSYFKDNRTNYDNGDNHWYDMAHTFTEYKPLTANTPYIISFPGERFYEFNLTGQCITFEANGGTMVPVTEAMTTTANGYVHNGTFLRSDIGDNAYAMNTDGTSFVNTSTAVEPFRTYMSAASSAANGGIIFIAVAEAQGIEFIGDHNDDSNMDDDSESYDGNGLTIYAKDRSIVVESTTDCILPCYNINGSLVGMWNIQRGTNIFNLHTGIYVIGGKKMVIR